VLTDALLVAMIAFVVIASIAAVRADAFRGRVRKESGDLKPATVVALICLLLAIAAGVWVLFT
jgi:hypothetical protein